MAIDTVNWLFAMIGIMFIQLPPNPLKITNGYLAINVNPWLINP
jgi:hypothetical protein